MAEGGGDYRLGTANPVTILELAVTTWCNYRCAYCVTPINGLRSASVHAFDRHPLASWSLAFARVPFEFALLCRGGEPFLDHEGFSGLLASVGALPGLRYLRVDTNGSWSPDRFESVPLEIRQRVQLNVSFHPTQIGLDAFEARLGRIVDRGWNVAMVNYVMEAGQAADYASVRDRIEGKTGIYVNPNPDAFASPFHGHGGSGRDLEALLPAIDLRHKTGARTAGKACFFPSIAYFIGPDGMAERACGVNLASEPRKLDFIGASSQLVALTEPVRCPLATCLCLDRYAFLEELPGRGRALNLLGEYVRDGRAHRLAARR
jgi:hypothetical protein